MNAKCRSCIYHSRKTHTCDYMLITNERRGCPVGACTRYESTEQARELGRYYSGQDGVCSFNEELLKLYDQGLNDAAIAKVVGKNRTIIARWRHRNGLPSRREREAEARAD